MSEVLSGLRRPTPAGKNLDSRSLRSRVESCGLRMEVFEQSKNELSTDRAGNSSPEVVKVKKAGRGHARVPRFKVETGYNDTKPLTVWWGEVLALIFDFRNVGGKLLRR